MDFGSFKKKLPLALFVLLLLPLLANAFAISSITTSATSSRVTTGTDVTVTASVTADSSGTATQISLSGTGQTTGSPLTVSDPSTAYYSTVSLSTSATQLSYVVSAGTADTYSYTVTGTYASGSASSTAATIQFVDPSAVTVSGSVSNTSNTVGNSFIVQVTLTNPSATQNVTTSYELTYNSTAFTVLSGDSIAAVITLNPSQSQVLSYTVNATSAVSSSPIAMTVGSNTAAYSQTVTNAVVDSAAPSITLSTPASGAVLTSSSSAFTFTFTDSDSSGAATCYLYIDSAKSGSGSSVAEGATGSITGSSLTSGSHTWFINCLDATGNSGNGTSRSFTVSLGSGSITGSTPTPTAVPTATPAPTAAALAPSLPLSETAAPTETAAGEAVLSTETAKVSTSTEVRGSFAQSSATFEVAYTAPLSGFDGEITYKLPLDYSDYQSGLVKITPEPKSVAPGSIITTWTVNLASAETFVAKVDVAKPVDKSVLKEFKAPTLKPISAAITQPSAPTGTPEASEAAPIAPKPADAADNTLLYVVGALVILGALYFMVFAKKGKD